jgi:hypothetical protein
MAMSGGRPPSGSKLVERLEGSDHAKRRLMAIIDTLAGKMTIDEACASVDVRASEFHKLRSRLLQEALQSLEPRPPGRPPRVETEGDARAAALEREVLNLKNELRTVRTREELFAAVPHLANRQAGEKSGGARSDGDGADEALPAGGDVAPGAQARGAADEDSGEAGDATTTA